MSRDVWRESIRDICEQVNFFDEVALIIVEMVMHAGETMVNERTWHRGDVALEHVVNITSRVSMTLPQ